jgi:DNA-binding transcriptional LysR family regulator
MAPARGSPARLNRQRRPRSSLRITILIGVGVLTAVTKAGGFSHAAETLGLTASGVSRAVARLQAPYRRKAIRPNLTGCDVDKRARRFHAQVMPLLASIEEAATEVAGTAAAVSGRLRVNVDPWFARMVLAPTPRP